MKKQDIVITTFFGTENYGSNIQAIALATTFKQMGYRVSFLKAFKNRPFLIMHPLMLFYRILNKLNRRKTVAFFVPSPYMISEKRTKRLMAFNDKHYKTVTFKSWREWKTAMSAKTIFVVGSDITWNPARGYPATNFLDFAHYAKLPCFSYAASVGDTNLPHKYYHLYRRYLRSMTEVGVREQAVADKLGSIIGREVIKVVDPSMLLTREQWDVFANDASVSIPINSNGYVACYFVMEDNRYWEFVRKIQEETNMQIVVIPMHNEDENRGYDTITDATLNEFIWLIKNATFICTDSFHACAMSLIYEKEFYLLRRSRKAEDDKFDDFLNRYNLSKRVVSNEELFRREAITDYSIAKEQLRRDKEESISFIKTALLECAANNI